MMTNTKASGFGRRAALAALFAGAALGAGVGAAQAQDVTIDFWDQIWGPEQYAVAAQKLVDQYNAETPGVKVVYRSVPWNNWYETYVTAIASGSAPDISTGAGFQAVQFYDFGEILPVDEVVAAMPPDTFAPGALDAVTYDGHQMALPWAIDIRVIYYRKDILAEHGIEPPKTWDELRAAAKAVTGDGVYGLVSSGDPGGMHWILAAAINNGGGLFDAEGKPALTGERSVEALEFLAGFVADGSLNPSSAGYKNDDARASFCRGEAAFMLNPPNQAAGCPESADQYGILDPIAGPHGDFGTVYWVNNIMVYKQTEHPEETMAFLAWWSEHQLPLWTEGLASSIPARTAFAADTFFTSNPQTQFTIEAYLPVAKPMSAQVGGTFPALNEIDGDGFLISAMQAIWQGQPVADVVGPAQAHLEDLVGE